MKTSCYDLWDVIPGNVQGALPPSLKSGRGAACLGVKSIPQGPRGLTSTTGRMSTLDLL